MTASDARRCTESLKAAGLAAKDVRAWLQAEPGETDRFSDRSQVVLRTIGASCARLLGQLPPPARRNEARAGGGRTHPGQRRARPRVRFLREHVDAVYDALTVRRSRFVRVEDLVIAGRGRGAGPGADRAGDRGRGGDAATRQGAGSRSTRACSSPPCSAARAPAGISATPCCCRGRRRRSCCRSSGRTGGSSLPARRCSAPARPRW